MAGSMRKRLTISLVLMFYRFARHYFQLEVKGLGYIPRDGE